MKKSFAFIAIFVFATSLCIAQVPQSFNYQAMARDNLGNILVNQNVSLRITILSGSANGTSVYSETHSPLTNQFGLFNVKIGTGTIISGDFSTIDWGANIYFIKTEMDAAGGTTYVLMGTSQLLSVPYALFSKNTANVDDADADPANEIQALTKTGSTIELSDGGGSVNDDVDDADNDPTNEYQSLSVVGNNLTISDGNTVSIPGDGGATDINGLTDGKTGGNSVFLGTYAGYNDDGTDNLNVAVGVSALHSNTIGSNNVAVGYHALYDNTTGGGNTSIGFSQLTHNTTGGDNTAIGTNALFKNSAGNCNTASGVQSLFSNTTGNNNIGIGDQSNYFNQGGSNNTIIGYKAGYGILQHNKSGNIFLGYEAGFNEQGSNKLYIENSSSATPLIYGEFDNNLLRVNGTLDINNAYQFPTTDGTSGQILQSNGSGTLDWATLTVGAIDIDGLADGKTIGNSVFLGSDAGANDDGTNNRNTALGMYAFSTNTSGEFNTAIGDRALYSNSSGESNTAIGLVTLYSNTTGDFNTAIGGSALYSNSSGKKNTATGYDALNSNTLGEYNTASGVDALKNNSTGDENTAIGHQASRSTTIGNANSIIGSYANAYNVEGSNNTMIGYQAGMGTGTHNKTGSVFIGYFAGKNENTSNKLYIENTSSSTPLIYGEFDNDLLRVNGTLDVNNAYQLPTTDGSPDQVLKTNGSGTLSWSSDAVGATEINGLIDGKTITSSVFLGLGSGTNAIAGISTTAIGVDALRNSVGYHNTATGNSALYTNISGGYNTATGSHALELNTIGSSNIAIGMNALNHNTSGNQNVAIGNMANFNNTGGSQNTIIGYEAGHGSSLHNKSGNVFIGYQAGYNDHGSNKLYIENSNGLPLIYGEFDNNFVKINGNLGVGANSFGGGTNTMAFYYTTAPPTTTAYNSVLLYSKWNTSNFAELYVLDEQGNETVLSPHNFNLITKSEPMAWSYYSENANVGKKINVDMLRLVRLVENVTGEKLAEIKDIDDDNKIRKNEEISEGLIQQMQEENRVQQKTIEQLIARIEKLEKSSE